VEERQDEQMYRIAKPKFDASTSAHDSLTVSKTVLSIVMVRKYVVEPTVYFVGRRFCGE
jgi:hypothetical protein